LKHYRAGTKVERIRSTEGALSYASKNYVAKKGFESAPHPGRFWGVVGADKLPLGKREVVKLSREQVFRMRRVIRNCRWSRAKPEQRIKLRASPLFGEVVKVKHLCNVEVWLRRLLPWLGVG
jgi:hypothetical protein